MCFQVIFKPSHRCIERELESSAKTKASTPLCYSSFAVAPHHSPLWYNLRSYVLFAKGEKVVSKGLIFHSKYPFLAIHAKGEKVLAQSKRTASPPNFKTNNFHLENFKLVSYCVQKEGESSIFKIDKTLLNTKRKILLRGSFV
jgi:hypothetical protein